jgi:trimeric autotransporter adhesin
VIAPQIAYTPFERTSKTTDRTLLASITDVSGIATGAFTPRIYYWMEDRDWASTQCQNVGNDEWVCNLEVSQIGGVQPGDRIYYYVVAQDTNGNLGSNPGGALGTDVNNITDPPPNLNHYDIVQAIFGELRVGPGEEFANITGVGGPFDKINKNVLTDNAKIIVTGNTLESCEVDLNRPVEEIEEGNPGPEISIVADPNSTEPVEIVSGDPQQCSQGLIRMWDPRKVVINGVTVSLEEPGLLFRNLVVGAAVFLIQTSALAPEPTVPRELVIKAVEIVAAAGGTGIDLGGQNGIAGDPDDDWCIEDNEISGGRAAITAAGYNGETAIDHLLNMAVVRNKLVYGSTPVDNAVAHLGVFFAYTLDPKIENNTISERRTPANPEKRGRAEFDAIGDLRDRLPPALREFVPEASGFNAGIIVGPGVVGGRITGNTISGLYCAPNCGARGIDILPGSQPSNLLIDNNIISDLSGEGGLFAGDLISPEATVGIRVIGPSDGVKIWNNSVNLFGEFEGNPQGSQSAAFVTDSTGLDVRNNVFANSLDNTASTTDKAYAIFAAAPTNTVFSTISHNNYYVSGPAGVLGGTESFMVPVARPTLPDWMTFTGQDAGSLSVDSMFVSAVDLHLLLGSPLIDSGMPLPGITHDIDGHMRPQGAGFDIGADEFVAPTSAGVSVSGRVMDTQGRGLPGVSVLLQGGDLGAPVFTTTNSFGYYCIPNIPAGQTYILTVRSRRYVFVQPSIVVNANEDVTNANFEGQVP